MTSYKPYDVDPVAYDNHIKINFTTLYYPLVLHGKFNNRKNKRLQDS